MKIVVIATLFASVIFLLVDIIWLSFSVKFFYKPNIGLLLNEKPVIWAAILFYVVYVIGLSIVVINPSIDKSISYIFLMGLVFK